MKDSCYVCGDTRRPPAHAYDARRGRCTTEQGGSMRTRTFRRDRAVGARRFSLVAAACGGDDDDDDAGGADTAGDATAATAPTAGEHAGGDHRARGQRRRRPRPPAPTAEGTTAPTVPPRGDADLVIWADDTRRPSSRRSPRRSPRRTASPSPSRRCRARPIREQFILAAPTGDGPDIVVGAHDWIGELSTNGVLEPLDAPRPRRLPGGRRRGVHVRRHAVRASRTPSRTSP